MGDVNTFGHIPETFRNKKTSLSLPPFDKPRVTAQKLESTTRHLFCKTSAAHICPPQGAQSFSVGRAPGTRKVIRLLRFVPE